MQRYSVAVTDSSSSEPLILLIPLDSTSTSAALIHEVVKRAARFGRSLDAKACTLHLSRSDGPILDPDDRLADLVFGEDIFAVVTNDPDLQSNATQGNHDVISIRILTPAISKQLARGTATLPAAAISLPVSAKIQHLHNEAVRHLQSNAVDPLDKDLVLDLHIHELPLAFSSFDSTLKEAGLCASPDDEILTIYVVARPDSKSRSEPSVSRIGMSDLYSVAQHWHPGTLQSDRGIAMYLSSLRVLCHSLKSPKIDDNHRDRVLRVFELLCAFPPAVRAFYMLMRGKTITQTASAALSQVFYHVLEDMVPSELINGDNRRLFESARLLLGFIVEKAKHLKFAASGTPALIAQFSSIRFGDLPSQNLHVSVPLDMVRQPLNATDNPDITDPANYKSSLVLPVICEVEGYATIFQPPNKSTDRKLRLWDIMSEKEFRDVHTLSVQAGRASLAVLRPSRLSSIAPEHLTFDQDGNVAVYTGKAGCAAPGEETLIFRPLHGEESPNIGWVEQQLAPFLESREKDGTNVFDALGSSQTRVLESPDEILVFCVDCSASMDYATNLIQVPKTPKAPEPHEAFTLRPSVFDRVKLDSIKYSLSTHEIYDDVLGAVVDSSHWTRAKVAENMLVLVFDMTVQKYESKQLQSARHAWRSWYLKEELEQLEQLAVGIKRFEQELIDWLVLSAMGTVQNNWSWSVGDRVPGHETTIPDLPESVTEVPHDIRCPISLEVLQDPVTAADGRTYSRLSIQRWFQIRKSSPLTGLILEDMEVRPHLALASQADKWVQAEDIIPKNQHPVAKRHCASPLPVTISFSGAGHGFIRSVPPSTSILDLYKIAFRGLRGRFTAFRLSHRDLLEPTNEEISAHGIGNGSIISIILNDSNTSSTSASGSALCLIKAYDLLDTPEFCYWVPKDTRTSFSSILAKYWRSSWAQNAHRVYKRHDVWTDLISYGDGRYRGSPRRNEDLIKSYLTPEHAFGSLNTESAIKEPSGSSANDASDDDEDEAPKPLVLKVQLNLRSVCNKKDVRLTRLDVLKQMFEAMINRIIAYSYKTHIGLTTFRSTATKSQSITHVVENFRRSVEQMEADGDTALWDGLKLAHVQIMEYAKKFPEAQRRIICLSDGNDTKSTAGPAEVCRQLQKDKIAVDSVCIGDDDSLDLKTVSNTLGSYCFKPKDLTTALAICEMEPVLSQTERPAPVSRIPTYLQGMAITNVFNQMRSYAIYDVVTRDKFPARKEHPRLRDSFIELANSISANSAQASRRPTLRAGRLLVEMREIASNPHPKYDCYVSETDMFFWKVVMEGPPDTPYADSAFLLYLDMPENFPTFPPSGRFVTPIFHPNINHHGRICHSIFDRDWTTDTTLRNILDTVYGLLFQAEASDAIHTTVTLGFHHDEAEFAVEARRHAEKHASKSRSEWKAQILSEIQEDDDEVGDDDMEDADDEDEDEDIEYGSDEEEDEDMIW